MNMKPIVRVYFLVESNTLPVCSKISASYERWVIETCWFLIGVAPLKAYLHMCETGTIIF